MSVRAIAIDCGEHVACHEFYVGVLGLTSPRQVWLRHADQQRENGEPAHHVLGLAVEVTDVDRVYHAARAAGHPITESLHDSAGERRFTVTDPHGMTVQVFTRSASQWTGPAAVESASQDSSAWAVLAGQTDLRWPYAVRAAATLCLADWIAGGTTGVRDLSARAGADPDALSRLLRYLSSRGVFREAGPDRFEMTPMAELLRDDHPSRLRAWLDLDGAGGRMDQAFSGLLDVVRTGKPAYPVIFGRSLWADLQSSPELAASFNRLMAHHSERFAAEIVACLDWTEARVVVDVGGGTGALLAAALRANAGLRGLLIDMEAQAMAARRRFLDENLAGRSQVVVASFLEPLPVSGDVYLLSRVLHDWNHDDTVRILRNCAAAGAPGARVIVIEAAIAENGPLERLTAMDLRMLAVYGGRERTVAEITEVAARAGLGTHRVTQIPSGLSVIDLRGP